MKTISISELHARTDHYVRLAATEPITVTDHGKPIAILESAASATVIQKPGLDVVAFLASPAPTLPKCRTLVAATLSERKKGR